MTSRERIIEAINFRQPDVVPLDLGATGQTGINASTLYNLRRELGLPEHPIKIVEPFQLLGEVEEDMLDALGVDVVGLFNPGTMFGYNNEGWKPWTMPDGTPVLMAEGFKTKAENGVTYVYPSGNVKANPSALIPEGGSFFDAVPRKSDFDEDHLTPREDYKDDFQVADDETARFWERESITLNDRTSRAIVGCLGGAGLGDAAQVPAVFLDSPKGIRSMDDWLMAHLLYPEYIEEVFSMQTDAMIKNLEIYKQAVGDRIQIVWISGTDFGTQQGTFLSLDSFRELYKPFYKKINSWVHNNTNWKTFYHSCGAVSQLIDDFIDMGVDILNPVQCSAAGMDAQTLKDKYHGKIVFWGGGVDTQSTLPFGSASEVTEQTKERIRIFSKGGGYVFAAIHNIVAKVPPKNLVAMFDTVNSLRMQ